ncbi:Aste57867_8462 [Aphanomyces stellatus]|uniref:Aste57867_8462 protein n=1 Tax=Aphanomyces stellatus TaxID=120398 RepID=A0A485KKG5_9STRA|nr:hypothetical protein As57867_008430 [Aphanomyces stellatus]VFT85348.1 Aste57867_8462 [Aphanomyces stellatus]
MAPTAQVRHAAVVAVAPARGDRTLGPRRQSIATIELTSFLRRPVAALAMLKHMVSSVHFAVISYLYFTTDPSDFRALQAYAPVAVGALMILFTMLHLHGFVSTVCCLGRARRTLRLQSWWRVGDYLLPASQIAMFHFVSVLCQSYQAYYLSQYLVDRTAAFSFSVVVALNCMVTPWFLLSRHKVVHASVVPLVESFLGFLVSTLFQSVVFLVPAVRYSFDRRLLNDDVFTTRLILLGRCMLVSSPLDLVTKIAIQFSSFVSLRKLVESMHNRAATSVKLTSKSTRNSRVSQHFVLQFHQNRRLLAYAIMSSVWGVALMWVSAAANWYRATCPTTCIYAFAPWWTLTCQCGYVKINCATSGITHDDVVMSLLHPAPLGSMVFSIDIRRCALTHGIPLATFVPFDNLYILLVAFSNMTDWPLGPNATLPSSLVSLSIRYSNLTELPVIFASLPSSMTYLRIEGASIASIPDSFYHAWANTPCIALNYLNLTAFPAALDGAALERLELRGNRIQHVPSEWHPPSSLVLIDLSANALVDGPWGWTNAGRVLDLSSNPIASIPANVDSTLLTTRAVVLDDTPYCAFSNTACRSKCAHLCQANKINDGRCDWVCFSAACNFDGGDCDSFGFTKG